MAVFLHRHNATALAQIKRLACDFTSLKPSAMAVYLMAVYLMAVYLTYSIAAQGNFEP